MTTTILDQLDLAALAAVSGGKSLAERAAAGAQACRTTNQQLGESNFPYAPCVQEQLRVYRTDQELYGPEGKGNGLMRSRHGITNPVPSVQFLGER